jgi:hypothetical protein
MEIKNKQSSIDRLIDQMSLEDVCKYSNQLAEAKEMQKEQIIDAYNQSWHFRDKPYETAEKYYNETYGGNK